MNRNTPLIVLSSIVGSFAIYCGSSAVSGGGGGGSVGTAKADPSSGACCDSPPPQFTKLAEGDLSATYTDQSVTVYGPDIDVSVYRQVSVLPDVTDGCQATPTTRFRADATSAHWGTGMPPGGMPVPVLAPVMRVGLDAWDSSRCKASMHYVVLGLK